MMTLRIIKSQTTAVAVTTKIQGWARGILFLALFIKHKPFIERIKTVSALNFSKIFLKDKAKRHSAECLFCFKDYFPWFSRISTYFFNAFRVISKNPVCASYFAQINGTALPPEITIFFLSYEERAISA